MQTIRTALKAAGRKLMTAGLLASMYQQHDEAEVVNAAVEALLVDPRRYRLSRAVAKAMGGDASFATEMLETLNREHPDDDRAKVTLAAAMILGGNSEWRSVIDRVLALSTDVAARTGATNLLDFLDKRAGRRQGRR